MDHLNIYDVGSNRPTNQLTNQSTNQSTNQPINQPINQSINQSITSINHINQSIDQPPPQRKRAEV
jgi:hypothetical protein